MIWYGDSEMKRVHRELVKASMERARRSGKRIGPPHVSERVGFPQRFAVVSHRIDSGELPRRQAAKELGIGYATLKRLLDARIQSSEERGWRRLSIENPYAEVLH